MTYYVHYYMDFGNTYNLACVSDADDAAALQVWAARGQDWQRITRQECRRLLSAERRRRREDEAFSGRASAHLYHAADLLRADWFGSYPSPEKGVRL